ncbi:MAG: hypothetical protein Q9M28_10315 [Mariprofundaceae bacterium]|nr:hypothetical protein [Mariprofundaceae bacterium]
MQQGFSFIKIILLTGIMAAAAIAVIMVLPVYNQSWKVQEAMETVVHFYEGGGEAKARKHLSELFAANLLNDGSLPAEFQDNLKVIADTYDADVSLSSEYAIEIWFLGELADVKDPSNYRVSDLKGMDILREKVRLVLEFSPSAKTEGF